MDYNTVVRSWKGNALLDLKRIKFIVFYENSNAAHGEVYSIQRYVN
jgi:ribosomal protein L30/L7E